MPLLLQTSIHWPSPAPLEASALETVGAIAANSTSSAINQMTLACARLRGSPACRDCLSSDIWIVDYQSLNHEVLTLTSGVNGHDGSYQPKCSGQTLKTSL